MLNPRTARLAALCFACMATGFATTSSVAANEIDAKVEAAVTAEFRTAEERARDANRKPLETLRFFGLTDGMDVLELVPGRGWYTKILAPVLAENGSLAVAMGTQFVAPVVEEAGWDVEMIETGSFSRIEGSPLFSMDGLDFGEARFDLVLTFRNLHNFDAGTRAALNAAVFRALRPGGLYGAIDHTRRHMQAETAENWRRMDPVLAIQEIQAAGFEFVDYSDLHYRPDDELRYEVGRRTVTGNTDRFTLLFRRPE